MKNLLLTVFIIVGLAACNNAPDNASNHERNIQLLTDSTAYHNDLLTDTSTTVTSEVVPERVAENPVIKKKITSSKKTETIAPVASAPSNIPNTTTPPATETHQDSVINNTGTANTGTIDNSGTSTTSSEPEVQKKKGWNKATQGAVIGGAAGAVGGAIISKKKGVGAVIGGIVGAAGGYIIGNNKDKKDKQSEEK
jgi:hypothetical protein